MNLLKRLAEEAQGGNRAPEGTEPQPQRSAAQIFRNQMERPDSVASSIPNSAVSSVDSSDGDNEYTTTNLSHRRRTNVPDAEFS